MEEDFLGSRLHYRELCDSSVARKSYRKLYSHPYLINDLDIVNELDGHSGCVNALSWSRSGRLLASGSDDQHLNIHSYQPASVNSQFQLTATVATGHTQNIFSVKFMPHSNDATVVTAAGDGEIRVFDLEYAGQVRAASAASSMASQGRRRGRNSLYDGVRYLSDGDTDSRVYRSHRDRVKRIVTESSPHLFLSCSEDGEVRQWDLRLPSSAYPRPHGPSSEGVPPPLISYKRYNLDLNTISCSASQPHYIALGGAHLHAFLHDRRMTGRDRLQEEGRSLRSINELSAEEQESLAQATSCVRRFAPKGQLKMCSSDNGHITACKISDARPDEMVVSWSGDHIYSFDLIRGAVDDDAQHNSNHNRRVRSSIKQKRKRLGNGSETSLAQDGAIRAQSRQRTKQNDNSQNTALRIRYRNGQTEDVPLAPRVELAEAQRNAERIAKASVKIRSTLLSSTPGGTGTQARATAALGYCASIFETVDETLRCWRYPIDPSPEQVYVQRSLRRDREKSRRFIQAAGTISRVLGGQLQTTSGASPAMAYFGTVETWGNDLDLTKTERFVYDFIKAILVWLDSGIGKLIESFTRPADIRASSKSGLRLPIPEADATPEVIDEYLIPYLWSLASDEPVIDVETNRFQVSESRQLYPNKKAAVVAFAAALRIPFADLSCPSTPAEQAKPIDTQEREDARNYWGVKVARGLLLEVSSGMDSVTVDRAFGGIGRRPIDLAAEEENLMLVEDATEDEGLEIQNVETVPIGAAFDDSNAEDDSGSDEQVFDDSNTDDTRVEEHFGTIADQDLFALAAQDEDLSDDDVEADEDDDGPETDDSSDIDEEDGVPNIGLAHFGLPATWPHRRKRPQVEPGVPCSGPTRKYEGHCNVRTVKDVNYFGPDDQYVVSGSDDGNLFIWDRKSSRLVNVLEGDGEVVNVIQGHPYETVLAVSGIDHTIKIFSPDARARQVARLGQEVSAHDTASFSSLSWPLRRSRRRVGTRTNESSRATRHDLASSEPALSIEKQAAAAAEDEEYVAPNGLVSRKRMKDAERIMRKNAVERAGGNEDAVITVGQQQLLQFLFAHFGSAGISTSTVE